MLLKACGLGGSVMQDGAVGLALADAAIGEVKIVAEDDPRPFGASVPWSSPRSYSFFRGADRAAPTELDSAARGHGKKFFGLTRFAGMISPEWVVVRADEKESPIPRRR